MCSLISLLIWSYVSPWSSPSDKTNNALFIFIADLFNFEYLSNLNNASIFDVLVYYTKAMINNDDNFIRLHTLHSDCHLNEEVPFIIKSNIIINE